MSDNPRNRVVAMNEEERFIFDLEGYLVIKNALSADEVSEINRIADFALFG